MARKTAPPDPTLAALAGAREDPASPAALREIRAALAAKNARAVARAAAIAADAGLAALIPDLRSAFDRLLGEPAKSDPGCTAKAAVAEALDRLEDLDAEAFLRGIRHVQLEPGWGGGSDSAVELRGICALALARTDPPGAMVALARLLADPAAPARINAARALAARGGDDALPLLHLRVLAGDPEPEVIGECLGAALRVAPDRSLDFVVGYLDADDDAVAEAAALALGGSRHAGAFLPLRAWCGRLFDAERRSYALLAISLLRSDEALGWLVARVREGARVPATEALTALAVHKGDTALAERVRAAVEARGDAELGEALARAFA